MSKERINSVRKGNNEEFNETLSSIISDDEVRNALEYATRMHEGQKRRNDEPYINHPIDVAMNVLKFKKSKKLNVLLMSAFLHDTLEDTSATYYDLVDIFGPQVASIVLELTTDKDMKNVIGKSRYLSIKMKNMSSWALVVKLCDRLSNINDSVKLGDSEFNIKYAIETIDIIEYLFNNAKLSKTHLTIIRKIIDALYKLMGDYFDRLNNISVRCNELLNQYEKQSKLVLC